MTTPRSIAGFRILRTLGEGGMGTVYQAVHPRTNNRVALKVVRPDLASDAELLARFDREAQAMARLDHPNLVRIVEAGQDQAWRYLAMELIDGTDLHVLVHREGAFSNDRVLAVAQGMLSALAAMHEAGIVHRDLKPANIMLDSQGRPIVMDLGLTRLADSQTLTASGMLVGTPRYLPPEFLETAAYTPSCDLYQAGLVLYEVATAHAAFDAKDFEALAMQIHLQRMPDLAEHAPQLSPGVHALIMRLLQRDPADRFATAREAASEAERLQAEGVDAEPLHIPQGRLATSSRIQQPGPRPASRNLQWPILAAGCLAMVLSGFLLRLLQTPDPPSGVDIVAGVDRIQARWSGGSPARVLVEGPDGFRYVAPREGFTAPPPDPHGRSALTVEGLRPDTEYTVRLEHPAGAGFPRSLRTAARLIHEDGVRVEVPAEGPPVLKLAGPLVTHGRVVVTSPSGTESHDLEPGHEHRVPLGAVSADAQVQVSVTGPTGGVEDQRFALREVLERAGERFLRGAGAEGLLELCESLGTLHMSSLINQAGSEIMKVAASPTGEPGPVLSGTFQFDRSRERDRIREETEARLESRGELDAWRDFAPLARWLLSDPAVPQDLRHRVRSRIGLLRRVARAMALGGVNLCPHPDGAPPEKEGVPGRPLEGGAQAQVLRTRDETLYPVTSTTNADRAQPVRVRLPPPPSLTPQIAEVRVGMARLPRKLALRVQLGDGPTRWLHAHVGSDFTGTLPVRLPPDEIPPQGAVLELELHDLFGTRSNWDADLTEVAVAWWPEPPRQGEWWRAGGDERCPGDEAGR